MNKTLTGLAILALVTAGCKGHGSNESLQREQQNYDVVQEGQTSTAVTSTINAPGEAAAPPTGLTGTNADTTSNFTLPQVANGSSATSTQPGTLAGTMTMPSNSGPMIGYPANPPRPRRSTETARTTTTTHTETHTDTTSTSLEGPPPTSSSTNPPTTDSAPPPPPRDDQKKPPSTDTTSPPPTTTTT